MLLDWVVEIRKVAKGMPVQCRKQIEQFRRTQATVRLAVEKTLVAQRNVWLPKARA